MQQTVANHSSFVDFDYWEGQLKNLQKEYQGENPFPHIMLDNFLKEDRASEIHDSFPKVSDDGWIHYVHYNEKKHGLNKLEHFSPVISNAIHELNSPRFVKWLSELTGIEGLKSDQMLEGGGLHQTMRGGFLNVHADFTVHPHKRNWRRRVNLIIYFNPDWEESYGGALELWDRQMKACEIAIPPFYNRCVIFNTDEDSFHGYPEPITCPEDTSRKSIALYYFTEETVAPKKRTTNYQARPTDGSKKFLIWLDKTVLAIYSRVKSTLGINDDFVSKVLSIFSKKK
ncbi:MAG: 2OG-Fe(II) oxygenase [Bacteroidota bacterium]